MSFEFFSLRNLPNEKNVDFSLWGDCATIYRLISNCDSSVCVCLNGAMKLQHLYWGGAMKITP